LTSTLETIASKNNFNLLESIPLSGGDINKVFRLKCEEGDYVVKLNCASEFPEMFLAEAKGLQLLENTNSFRIPRQIATGAENSYAYLLMEFITSGPSHKNIWEHFARNLVKLHRTSRPKFGLDHNNYIGSLPQQNNPCDTGSEFYITQRLEPQFQMASQQGFRFKNLEILFKNIGEAIPKEIPSLIHGDLWGGNYLVSDNAKPVLIDPAIAYAPREMDVAMMKLFGGFPEEVFDHYNSLFPLEAEWENRLAFWQLYYLLVHLNLFGSGYLTRVKTIVSNFS